MGDPRAKIHYLYAALIAAAVTLLHYALAVGLGFSNLGFAYPAAIFCAAAFGLRPALLEIVLSTIGVYFVFYEPRLSPGWRPLEDTLRVLLYFLAAVAIAWYLDRGRRAERERRVANEQAERARQRLDDFFNKAPMPLAVLEGDNYTFELANEEYLRLVGAQRSLLGRSVFEALPELSPEIRTILRNVYEKGERFEAREFPLALDWDLNGQPYEKYLSFIYEPLRNAGRVEGIMVFAYDVTELVRARKRVEESERQARAFAEAMPQMAFVADASGAIVYFNNRWYEYVGMARGETEGWGWRDYPLHHPEDLDRTVETWSASLRTGASYEIEYRLRRHDGTYRWHLGRALPVRNQQGEVILWFGTNTDIHDQKLAQEQLASAVRVRDDFLSVASHELRTPVTSLLLQNQLYERNLARLGPSFFTENRIRQLIEQQNRAATRLARLMDDILDVNHLSRHRLDLDLADHDAANFVRDVVERMRPNFTQRSVPLTVKATGPIPARFDAGRIERVLTNLLGNALKYGRGAPVEISAIATEDTVTISVRDKGPGIPPSEHARIFQRFERANADMNVKGLGLGLFISLEIAAAHGGDLSLTSEPGQGATFELRLPRDPAPTRPDMI